MKPVTLLLFFFVMQTYCRIPSNREGKWFGYTYTSTIIKSQHVTSLIPSSCIQYAATIPPCRDARSLDLPEARFLFRNTVEESKNVTVEAEKRTETVQNTTGWGQYLGLLPPTVTVQNTKIEITRMLDPGRVLTFSITGCRPSKLPLDLPKCPDDNNNNANNNEIIKPTPSVVNIITTTVFQERPTTTTTTQSSLSTGEGNVQEQQSNTATQNLPTTPKIIVEEASKVTP